MHLQLLQKILLLLIFVSLTTCETVFELDLTNGYSTQFEPFQTTAYAKDATDAATSDPVITFTQLSKYYGIIQKEWMESSNGVYFITILFKGDAGKRTGGYMGYIRSDSENIQKTIGLDQDDFMDVYQFYEFKSGEGQWNRYQAYLEVPEGVKIKLMLEQGSYFGLEEKYYAAFKELKVTDDKWEDECPGDDETDKQSYFTSLFEGMNLANKVWTTMSLTDDHSIGYFTFNYIDFKAPCVIPQFYILDKDGDVINTFELTENTELDLNYYSVKTWKYSFTLSQIENSNCFIKEFACAINGINETCLNYTCDYNFHFYYDLGASTEFNTLQEEYDYSKENSQVKYDGEFSVIVFKENSTVLNTVVYTKNIDNTVCTGICQINMDLTLGLKVKFSGQDEWETPGTTSKNVTWGDQLDIKIESNPKSGYKLSIMEIYATTEFDQNIQLGQMYIDSYLQNQDASTEGELTFTMKVSGEAGNIQQGKIYFYLKLFKGKKYNLKFLVETTAISSRLLADDDELPLAQKTTSDFSIQIKNAASRIYLNTAFIILLLGLLL